ncbi:MAG: DUF6609 family protein [Thermotogota bacterium]
MIKVKKSSEKASPFIRLVGLWLMLIGIVILISLLIGGKFFLNPFVFMIGYSLSIYIVEFNVSIRKKFILKGELSKFQKKMSKYGDISLFPLIFIFGGSFIPTGDWRLVWLNVFLATGIHFLFFLPVNGKIMLYLSLLCTLNPLIGIIFDDTPFIIFGLLDFIIKFSFGIYIFIKHKPKNRKELSFE